MIALTLPPPSHKYPTHTVPTLQSYLSLLISKSMFKGFLMYPCCEYTLLWSIQPLPLLSLTPSLPPRIIQQLSILNIIFSTFSFPSFPKFHKGVPLLHTCLYMVMFVFVYMLIFWIYLPHMRENMWPLSFWTWLTSLNMMSSNCIHLHSDHMVSFFLMAE
jgi:hypothetical protein